MLILGAISLILSIFSSKRPDFLHACATCSELPSNIITIHFHSLKEKHSIYFIYTRNVLSESGGTRIQIPTCGYFWVVRYLLSIMCPKDREKESAYWGGADMLIYLFSDLILFIQHPPCPPLRVVASIQSSEIQNCVQTLFI